MLPNSNQNLNVALQKKNPKFVKIFRKWNNETKSSLFIFILFILAKFHTKNNIAKEALAAKKLSGIYLFF
jgi:hypothetical protein